MWRKRLASLYRLITQTPVFELPEWQRRIAAVLMVLKHCVPRITDSRSRQMAAALTYHTVFSLLPTIVLVLITLQAFLEPDDRAEMKAKLVNVLLEPIISDPIVGTDSDPQPLVTAADGETLTEDERRKQEFEQYRLVMEKEVTAVLERLESVSFGGIGLFGLLLFLYGTTGLLTTIESTFDEVFGAHRNKRPAYRRIPVYYAILTLGPLLLMTGQWAQGQVVDLIRSGSWTAWLGGPLVVLSPILSVWALLYAMFVLMPTSRVQHRAAAVGSLVSAIFWVAGIELFGLYVSQAAITSLYGALALFPISLFWLFITWQLLLLGMEFTFAVQVLSETGRLPEDEALSVAPPVLSPGWTLEVAARIGSAFRQGQVVSLGRLQRSTGLPREVTRSILTALCRVGVVHDVDGRQGYGLARPANRISVDDLLEIHRVQIRREALVRADSTDLRARFHDVGHAGFYQDSLDDLVDRLDRVEEVPVPIERAPDTEQTPNIAPSDEPEATDEEPVRTLRPVPDEPAQGAR